VINILNIGRRLSIADPSMRELEGCILVTIGVKKQLRSLITPGKGKLTRDGLIKKKRNMSTFGEKDSGARLA
jgi:hypothetical protein